MNLGMFVSRGLQFVRKNGIVAAMKTIPIHYRHNEESEEFDRRWGTDTSTTVPAWSLCTASPNVKFAVQYKPSGETHIKAGMSLVGRSPADFTFVDLGSGKGLALILASLMGFREVFGVEFANDLVEIAKRNIEIVGISNVVLVHADAMDYKFPPGDLVIYMYNPFRSEVMRPVVANLARTITARPTDKIYVIYTNPECRAVLDEEPCLEALGHPPGQNYVLVWKSLSR